MILVTVNVTLASELVKLSTDVNPIISLSRKNMDIIDEYVVSDVIKKYVITPNKPKYLIHTAALTKPMEINDTNPIESLSVNIVGTSNVAKICHKYGIKFIYISTDFVYDGDGLMSEDSPVKPSNNYGWSKLGGETKTVYDFVSQYQTIKSGGGEQISPSIRVSTRKLKGLLNE